MTQTSNIVDGYSGSSVTFGFDQVEIAPMPGHLTHLTGQMGQVAGRISADLHFEGDHVCGTVSLPAGLQGSFCYADQTVMLRPGAQPIEL